MAVSRTFDEDAELNITQHQMKAAEGGRHNGNTMNVSIDGGADRTAEQTGLHRQHGFD